MQSKESFDEKTDSHRPNAVVERGENGYVSVRKPQRTKTRLLHRSLSNTINLAKRPVSPGPTESESYEATDGCNIPYCPVHGIASTGRFSPGQAQSTKRRPFRSNTITLDEGESNNKPKTLGELGRSVSDGRLIQPLKLECIKDAQKRRMRELNRHSTDNVVRQSIETRDRVNDELRRRLSAPPRVNTSSDDENDDQ